MRLTSQCSSSWFTMLFNAGGLKNHNRICNFHHQAFVIRQMLVQRTSKCQEYRCKVCRDAYHRAHPACWRQTWSRWWIFPSDRLVLAAQQKFIQDRQKNEDDRTSHMRFFKPVWTAWNVLQAGILCALINESKFGALPVSSILISMDCWDVHSVRGSHKGCFPLICLAASIAETKIIICIGISSLWGA